METVAPAGSPEILETPEALGALVAEYPHGRVPRELRRRQVIAVATALFIERGYVGVSMEEVARRAGVTKPVVYDLAGSKDQLFHEIVMAEAQRLAARVQRAVESEPESALKLRAGTLAFFEFIGDRRAAWRSLMAQPEAPLTTQMAGARRFHAGSVASLLAKASVESGRAVSPLVLDALAHAINGATEALALWWNDHPELTPEQLADLTHRLVGPGLLLFGEADALTT